MIDAQVLGPPDIEEKVGLTGGHIFQGECLPQYMWEQRLTARTPMQGLYLCGACTHPGGSVIGDERAECGDGGAAGSWSFCLIPPKQSLDRAPLICSGRIQTSDPSTPLRSAPDDSPLI